MKILCLILTILTWVLLTHIVHPATVLATSNDSVSKPIFSKEIERNALLKFKQHIKADHCSLLTSWGATQDCCQWLGVHCSNRTGHVIKLNLRGRYDVPTFPCLSGKVSDSLLDLNHLKYLDLSFNDFQSKPIPSFIGSLSKLEYLNLSSARFRGIIPHQLGNLSMLSSLDLSHNQINGQSLSWLPHLESLRDINLSATSLNETTNWFSIVNSLPFLEILRMNVCNLKPQLPPSLSYTNSSKSLQIISLSGNDFNGTSIFQWLFNLSGIETNLQHLDLCNNQITGEVPVHFERLNSLSYLDLNDNNFLSEFPSSIWKLQNLTYLSLRGNQLEGHLPITISNLRHLTYLDLSGNNFQVSGDALKSLVTLCSLQTLRLAEINLASDILTIIQSFSRCAHISLVSLDLRSTGVWGAIPDSISKFTSLRELHLSHNRLNGTLCTRIGRLSMLDTLEVSSNALEGVISEAHLSNLSNLSLLDLSDNPSLVINISHDWFSPFQLAHIYIGSCRLGPLFPKWLLSQKSLVAIDISNGGISDTIPPSIWNSMPNLTYLNMSHNLFYGALPDICAASTTTVSLLADFFDSTKSKMPLSALDLSYNLLTGKLPDCWAYFDQLRNLHLESNNFSGKIPTSLCSLKELEALDLRNNTLSGELPMCLDNCSSLVILDLSHNSLTGYIHSNIGNMHQLSVLSLRSNKLSGTIPLRFCELSLLQILDLSANHISGGIPKCIQNLTRMTTTQDQEGTYIKYRLGYKVYESTPETAWVMWKGIEFPFRKSLGLVRGIDFSDNELEGEIPDEIASLVGLSFLNLSENHLFGRIVQNIGQLKSLQALDLSDNHLSGEIPTSLADISFLAIMDVSNNDLSGKIPLGTQLQTFDPSMYTGNPGLCGTPLPRCAGDKAPSNTPDAKTITQQHERDSNDMFPELYISVLLGFIIGFWGVCGTLIVKRSWRHAFYRFYDDMKDQIYVIFVLHIVRAWKRS